MISPHFSQFVSQFAIWTSSVFFRRSKGLGVGPSIQPLGLQPVPGHRFFSGDFARSLQMYQMYQMYQMFGSMFFFCLNGFGYGWNGCCTRGKVWDDVGWFKGVHEMRMIWKKSKVEAMWFRWFWIYFNFWDQFHLATFTTVYMLNCIYILIPTISELTLRSLYVSVMARRSIFLYPSASAWSKLKSPFHGDGPMTLIQATTFQRLHFNSV